MRGAVLAAKPVNDTILLSMSLTLPGGFGYVLNELNASIVVDTASDWESRGDWRLSQTSVATRDFTYRFPVVFDLMSQNGVDQGVRATRVSGDVLTHTPIIPRSTGATQSLAFSNLQAAVGAAGTFDAVISFWEYDLEQMVYFPVHSAIGVYQR